MFIFKSIHISNQQYTISKSVEEMLKKNKMWGVLGHSQN